MQAAKDTFLKTLAARLAVVNPARTIIVDGASRPAVLAVENESPLPANAELEAFLLRWEGVGEATEGTPLMYVDCKVSYGSQGTDSMLRTDRGRIVTAMDGELMQLCRQRSVAKCDYTQTPPCALGTNIFWTAPAMEAPGDVNGVLQRTATIRVFFFPEVA
jgi:hypothetical protein